MEQLKLFGSDKEFDLKPYGYLPPIKKDVIYPERDYLILGKERLGDLTSVEKSVENLLLSDNQLMDVSEEEKVILTHGETLRIREYLLVESVKSAFGESRGGRKRKPSDEAWEWIISEERELPFSFDRCCLACGLDPEKMLDSLRYYKRKLLG